MPNCEPQSPRWLSRTTRYPERGIDPGQAVADHRRAQVPHVHRLGDIGRGEVDDDGLRPARAAPGPAPRPSRARRNAEATHASWRRRLRNPGPATSGGPAKGARSTARRQLRGQIARFAPQCLGEPPCSHWPDNRQTWDRSRAHRLLKGRPVNTFGQGSAKRFAQASE